MKLVDIKSRITAPAKRRAYSFIAPPVESFLAVPWLNGIYDRVHELSEASGEFFPECLTALGANYKVSDEDLERIPKDGPVVTVSNHPFGVLDAIIVGDILTGVRRDTKFLANFLLNEIPEARRYLIAVDPFENSGAPVSNLRPMREAVSWLRDGHALGTFPAGEVSHMNLRERAIMDVPWSPHIATLVEKSDAWVLPIYLDGRNSLLFLTLGLIHPIVRTAMLARELRKKASQKIPVAIGPPIPASKLARMDSKRDRIDHLRMCTHILRNRTAKVSIEAPRLDRTPVRKARISPQKHTPDQLQREIDSLPPDACIYRQREFSVHIAEASQIPKILPEIGRLREQTFREVGEGTGNDADLEPCDQYYLHNFVWNNKDSEMVGAYRLGLSDRILGEHGQNGLYTSSLFNFSKNFLESIDPAIELGRSFVCSRYQRKHSSLALLWKGILHWMADREPKYRILFGPVSISQEYNAFSKNLIVQYMRRKLFHPEISAYVKPRNPFKAKRVAGLEKEKISPQLKSIEDVSALISEIEDDGKGVPILLRHYLKMDTTLLSFNVDPNFSDVLDGLLLTDVATTNPALLKLYMGEERRDRYLHYHGINSTTR